MRSNWFITACCLVIPFFTVGQYNPRSPTGVQWTTELTWEQVKMKAKQENKYIFLDAFATWCGPCKMMDKDVYTNDSVGRTLNESFISVQVQMDRTVSDDEQVKKWYTTADQLKRKYFVTSFPTFIFLAPNGEIVEKISGYRAPSRFVYDVQQILKPGRPAYVNPLAEYERLLLDYDEGRKNFSQMPYLIKVALKQAKDYDRVRELLSDYINYLFENRQEELYSKANLQLFGSDIPAPTSTSRVHKFYVKNSKKVDNVLGKGAGAQMIDRTIHNDFTIPFISRYGYDPLKMSQVTPGGIKEPDWDSLYSSIRKNYSKVIAQRNLLAAKLYYYQKSAQYEKWAPLLIKKIDQYGLDTAINTGSVFAQINMDGWVMFQKNEDKRILQKAAKMMEVVVYRYPNYSTYIDTYANLLYKVGQIDKAIKWERMAVEAAASMLGRDSKIVKNYNDTIEKMEKGEKTWTGRIF